MAKDRRCNDCVFWENCLGDDVGFCDKRKVYPSADDHCEDWKEVADG